MAPTTADPRFEDLVELYAAATRVEADRIVLLLEEDGVEAMARETTMTSFPSPAEAHVLVLVRSGDRDKAKATVEAAVREGAVSEGGQLL
jgi:hypothetical protein